MHVKVKVKNRSRRRRAFCQPAVNNNVLLRPHQHIGSIVMIQNTTQLYNGQIGIIKSKPNDTTYAILGSTYTIELQSNKKLVSEELINMKLVDCSIANKDGGLPAAVLPKQLQSEEEIEEDKMVNGGAGDDGKESATNESTATDSDVVEVAGGGTVDLELLRLQQEKQQLLKKLQKYSYPPPPPQPQSWQQRQQPLYKNQPWPKDDKSSSTSSSTATIKITAEELAMLEKNRPAKRALSAFNLFYRYKRAKIIEDLTGSSSDNIIDEATAIIMATPGLENSVDTPQERIPEVARREIHSVLKDNLLPQPHDTRRAHRKSNNSCGMTFVDLAKIMGLAWKSIDNSSRRLFEELAEQGQKIKAVKVAEYEKLLKEMGVDQAQLFSLLPEAKKKWEEEQKKKKKAEVSGTEKSAASDKITNIITQAKARALQLKRKMEDEEMDALIDELCLDLPDNEYNRIVLQPTRKKRRKVFPRFTKYFAGGPISGSEETPLGSRATSDALSGVTNETTNPFETPLGRNQSEAFTRRGGTSGIALGSQALDSVRHSNPREAAAAMHIQRPAQYQEQELQQYPRDDMVPDLFKRYTVTFYPTGTDNELGISLSSLNGNLTVCMIKHDHLAIKAIGTGPSGEKFKIQVGDIVIPTIQNGATLPTANTLALLTWFTNKFSRARDNINGMTVSFWRPIQGTFEEKAAFYRPIIEELKVSQDRDYNNNSMYVSVSSVETSQTINDDTQGSCSAISLSIIEKHVMLSGFNMSGVTLDGIKESIDTDGPGLMQEVSGTEGRLVTDDEIISYMQREQRLSKLHNSGVIHGNVLFLEDTLKICEGISRSVGKCGGALFFNKHTVTILRSPSPYEPSQSNNEPYVYEFIESLPSDDHNGQGYRIVCTSLSSLHIVIIQYFYDKMRQMDDIDTIAKLPWTIEEVKQGDPRLFYVHYFACPALPDPDEGKGEQPPNDSIIAAVDACFDNGSNTAVTYEQVSNILAIDVDSMTRGTKVAIDNRSRVLLSQPTVTAIKNVVDELYTRAIDDDFVSKESIIDEIVYRYKMNVELTDDSCSVIVERMNAWLDDSTKAVAKLEECHNYEIVKAYPSISICAEEERLDLNQLEEDLKRNGHSRISGHPRLVHSERTLFWKFEKGIPTIPHIKAILNGKQTQIEKLAVTGESVRVLAMYDYANAGFNRNQASIVNYLSQGDVDEVEIARKKYMKQMETGGFIMTVNDNECYYYRYKVPHKKAAVYTHEHILAIVNGTVEDVVEVFELPNIDTPLTPAQLGFDESEYISIEQCQQKFGVGLKHLAIKLRRGGFVRKHEDQMYWIQYKYPFKLRQATNHHPNSHVVELTKSELVIKCAEALRKKSAKSRTKIARRDCREVKRLSKSSRALLETLVNDVDTHHHATIVPPWAMERSDDDKQKRVIYVYPINMLSDETKQDLDIQFNNKSSNEVYSTRRFLESCRLGQQRNKRKPLAKFYILTLYVKSSDQGTTPVGLVANGEWKTQGCESTWKTVGKAQVRRVIEVQLGTRGNLCDDDTSINIIRDDGDMDTVLCVNVKRGLNEHSDRYNHGLFQSGDESDDESVGQEKRFAGEDANDGVIFADKEEVEAEEVEAAVEDITEHATIDGHNVRIEFDDLSNDTIFIKQRLLKRAFKEAQTNDALHTKTYASILVRYNTALSSTASRYLSSKKLDKCVRTGCFRSYVELV